MTQNYDDQIRQTAQEGVQDYLSQARSHVKKGEIDLAEESLKEAARLNETYKAGRGKEVGEVHRYVYETGIDIMLTNAQEHVEEGDWTGAIQASDCAREYASHLRIDIEDRLDPIVGFWYDHSVNPDVEWNDGSMLFESYVEEHGSRLFSLVAGLQEHVSSGQRIGPGYESVDDAVGGNFERLDTSVIGIYTPGEKEGDEGIKKSWREAMRKWEEMFGDSSE